MKSTSERNKQIGIVSTFHELVATKFQGHINAMCWQRSLAGDFGEIVAKLRLEEDVTVISLEELATLDLTAEGQLAREIIINDFTLLKDVGALPSLNLIKSYPRDEEFDFISTDVYSFHVDRSPIATDTFLCTYYGASSDIIPNDEVQQKIKIPEIRQQLKDVFGGAEQGFEDFLQEHFFDLHYQPNVGGKAYNLGVGNLWKLAVDHPEQEVLPCVHRAPTEREGEYRLLLIC